MQQKELKELREKGHIVSVTANDRGVHWNVLVQTIDESFIVIRTARGGQREFKTLDAVKKMLKEVDIDNFKVA